MDSSSLVEGEEKVIDEYMLQNVVGKRNEKYFEVRQTVDRASQPLLLSSANKNAENSNENEQDVPLMRDARNRNL